MRGLVLGLAVLLLIGCGPGGAFPSADETSTATASPPPRIENVSADTALPALVRRICSAKSVKVDFVVSHSVERTGSSERSPAGESRGSLTVIKDGEFSFSERTQLFGSTYELNATSDGRRLRVSGTLSGHGDGASIVDTPRNMNENLLMSFIQNGSDLERFLGPMSEGRPVDVESRFQVSGTKLGAAKRKMIIGRKVQALEYTLRERGTGYAEQVTLWIDVASGLPVGRDVVEDGGPNGRMVSSATYEITLDGDSSQAASETGGS